jgi:hypothetical protein
MLHYSADKIISHRPTRTFFHADHSEICFTFETGQLEGLFWQNHRP